MTVFKWLFGANESELEKNRVVERQLHKNEYDKFKNQQEHLTRMALLEYEYQNKIDVLLQQHERMIFREYYNAQTNRVEIHPLCFELPGGLLAHVDERKNKK